MNHATDPKLIEALGRASSIELFQLNTLLERMLADPRRVIAVRANIHLGQTVRFVDWRDGRMREARVTAMGDAQVTLFEEGPRREWMLPYVAVEPPTSSGGHATPPQPMQQASPPPLAPSRADFQRGDKVSFEDRYLQRHVGVITRINKHTATIDTGDGKSWRVSFSCCGGSSTSDHCRGRVDGGVSRALRPCLPIFEMNVESYRRRTAIERKQVGAGRPANYATPKNVGAPKPGVDQPST